MYIKFCIHMQFKQLAHVVSLLLSLVMGIMILLTSSLMVNLYTKYCDYIKDHYDNYNYQAKCGKDENHFLILPVFGYFTLCAWVRVI